MREARLILLQTLLFAVCSLAHESIVERGTAFDASGAISETLTVERVVNGLGRVVTVRRTSPSEVIERHIGWDGLGRAVASQSSTGVVTLLERDKDDAVLTTQRSRAPWIV